MSLVAYGSSDESSDEEVNNAKNHTENSSVTKEIINTPINETASVTKNQKTRMILSVPRSKQISAESEKKNLHNNEVTKTSFLGFGNLPKPKNFHDDYGDIPEENDVPLFKPKEPALDKPTKSDRTPARISIPSLSEFKDVDEDLQQSKNKPTASKKGTGLFAILPPPKHETVAKKSNLIPHVLTKAAVNSVSNKTVQKLPSVGKTFARSINEREVKKIMPVMDYDSNSEDDDDENRDFFSLTKPTILPEIAISASKNFFTIPAKRQFEDSTMNDEEAKTKIFAEDTKITETIVAMDIDRDENSSTLVSTVMNLPRDEIMLKNKAEIGPKLPVPEQEYNVDAEGNVAFDEKAIEYLCGKRGVKRKNKMIEEANIIEINGEDIKPDEREWLVKALTEEPVQRPVSMQGAGPSTQSKKKHQITYLAHQAKAMEVELKNTWSQNRSTKKQTQSKYGF